MFKKADFVTLIAVSLSITAIAYILKGDLYTSFIFGILAFIFDCFDGFVARKFKEDSGLGRQLDSQSDTVIYLIYPLLVFHYYFYLNDIFSVIIQSIFVFTGIYRLSRFNDKGYVNFKGRNAYPGVPVVFSFLNIILFILINKFLPSTFYFYSNTLILVHSILMVSSIPFPKPKTEWVVIFLLLVLIILTTYGKSFI